MAYAGDKRKKTDKMDDAPAARPSDVTIGTTSQCARGELLSGQEIVIVIFGASRLPEIGRGIGSAIRNFKDATKEK